MKLPAAVYSMLGAVPVTLKEKIRFEKRYPFGLFRFDSRAIEVENKQCAAAQLAALCHEMTHVALYDAGVPNALSDDAVELVCDAVGTYIAAAVQAGYIKLQVPKGNTGV